MAVNFSDELLKYNQSLGESIIDPLDDQKNPTTPYEPEKEVDFELAATTIVNNTNLSGDGIDTTTEATTIVNNEKQSGEGIDFELAATTIVNNTNQSEAGIDADAFDFTDGSLFTPSDKERSDALAFNSSGIANPKSNGLTKVEINTDDQNVLDGVGSYEPTKLNPSAELVNSKEYTPRGYESTTTETQSKAGIVLDDNIQTPKEEIDFNKELDIFNKANSERVHTERLAEDKSFLLPDARRLNENIDTSAEGLNKAITTDSNGIYQPVGSGPLGAAIGDIAKRSMGSSKDWTASRFENPNIQDLSTFNREEESITSDAMRFFLYNNVPYVLGEVAEAISSITRTVANVSASAGNLIQEWGTIKGLLDTYNNLLYYTPLELGLQFTATFTTLGLLPFSKGINVKFRKSQLSLAPKWAVPFGEESLEDLIFGEEPRVDFLKKLIDKVKGAMAGVNNPSRVLEDSEAVMTKIEKILRDRKDEMLSKIDDEKRGSTPDRYYDRTINPKFNYIGKDTFFPKGSKPDLASGDMTPIDIHLTNWREVWKAEKDLVLTKHADNFKDGDAQDAIYNTERNKTKVTEIAEAMETSYRGLQDNIEKMASNRSEKSIGSIYVYPTLTDNGISNFKIPFQFVPTLSESGQAARYESMNMLHRQGSIMSYVQTEGETLSLETTYMMTSDGRGDTWTNADEVDVDLGRGPENTWYDTWTPEKVQAIERVLRSLVLPYANVEDSAFNRPPIVKIYMGKPSKFGSDNEEYKEYKGNDLYPMLTYPIEGKNGIKFYHRTYVVTKVAITKDMVETPLYVDNEGYLIDTHSFKVSLELAEIDYNYIGVLPDFGSYFNSYKSHGSVATAI